MTLDQLFNIILDRQEYAPAGSYTASLFAEGLPKIAQKVGEEATETVVAALSQDDQRLIEELADLTFHALVLLAARRLKPGAVMDELDRRHAG